MTNRGLIRYLRYAVHGETEHQRAPRRRSRRGPARSPKYRAWIRTQPSLVSGRFGCEACHTQNNGMSSKGTCYSCVPLTPEEHREYDAGREAFEQKYGLDMRAEVRRLNDEWLTNQGRAEIAC